MAERTYTTVDKSDWPTGEWNDEPDKVQFKDEATGFPCLAVRHVRSGHWCGYVGVPEGHPAFEKDYDDVRVTPTDPDDEYGDWPDVHGGLTYAGACVGGPEESSICHVPDPGEPDHVWWLGFDCAHSGDLSPGHIRLNEKYGTTMGSYETYKPLAYVRSQCVSLARQLATAVPA